MRHVLTAGILFGVALTTPRAAAQDKQQLADDEARFRATLKVDGKVVLEFFHKLTLSDADANPIRGLIRELDADAFKVRDKAHAALVAEGPAALPLLRQALPGATLEKRLRLERILKVVEPPEWAETVGAAARLLKDRRPDGAVAALLAYTPFMPDAAADDVLEALCGLGVKDGKIDAPLLAALTDKVPTKRAAAAVVVGAFGNADQRIAVPPRPCRPAACSPPATAMRSQCWSRSWPTATPDCRSGRRGCCSPWRTRRRRRRRSAKPRPRARSVTRPG
jgi:hypothetical protein